MTQTKRARPAKKAAPGIMELAVASIEETKAQDLVAIDVSARPGSLFDGMLICTATSTRHAAAIANRLRTDLKRAQVEIHGFEGPGDMGWTLLDAGEVIVHIFLADTRAHYDLESLWEAPAK